MKRLIITNEKFIGELELVYDLDGVLFATERRADFSREQARWVYANLPLTTSALAAWVTAHGFQALEVPADLSFEAFWKGWLTAGGDAVSRERAKLLWVKKSDRDKTVILWSLRAYGRYIRRSSWYKPMWPDAYLGRKAGYQNDWDTVGDNAPKQPKRDTL